MQTLNQFLECHENVRKLDASVFKMFLIVLWQYPNTFNNCSVQNRLACKTVYRLPMFMMR